MPWPTFIFSQSYTLKYVVFSVFKVLKIIEFQGKHFVDYYIYAT